MPRLCAMCGKKTSYGKSLAHRGRAKHLGGVGIKTTGVTRRKFKANLQKVRVQTENGTVTRLQVCAQCIRSGKVTKPKRRRIPTAGAASGK